MKIVTNWKGSLYPLLTPIYHPCPSFLSTDLIGSLAFTCRLQWQSYCLLHTHERREKLLSQERLNLTSNFFASSQLLYLE